MPGAMSDDGAKIRGGSFPDYYSKGSAGKYPVAGSIGWGPGWHGPEPPMKKKSFETGLPRTQKAGRRKTLVRKHQCRDGEAD